MEVLMMTAQIILSLSILVGLHELGHHLTAKYFGMRVEKFSIGFPPKLFGFKWGETEYSIGAVPLGGFVKITGMIDESLDTENLDKEPEEWEFRAKPAWQRLIVMIGGIVVNLLLGMVIFIGLIYAFGETYIPKSEIDKYGIVAYDYGQEIGLQTGDKVLNVNGQEYEKFTDLVGADVLVGSDSYYTVERNGETIKVDVPNSMLETLSGKDKILDYIGWRIPFKVGKVTKKSGADKGGLKKDDLIVNVEGAEIQYFDELRSALIARKGTTVAMQVKRGADLVDLKVAIDTAGIAGFAPISLVKKSSVEYSLLASIPKGASKAFETLWANIRGFGKIFRGEVNARKSVGGPIKIAEAFGGTWDPEHFWTLTGVLSMWLAFMNFLPIPALDGGHVAFLSYEIISGRKPSDKFLEKAQIVGMVLLLGLMALIFGNDIYSLIERFLLK